MRNSSWADRSIVAEADELRMNADGADIESPLRATLITEEGRRRICPEGKASARLLTGIS